MSNDGYRGRPPDIRAGHEQCIDTLMAISNPGRARMRFYRLSLSAAVLLLAVASVGRAVVIEDWTSDAVGRHGIPSGWVGETFGRRAEYDFVNEEHMGRRFLHLRSRNEHSTIVRDIAGQVNLVETPILEWSWRATILPTGGDLRRRETTDL